MGTAASHPGHFRSRLFAVLSLLAGGAIIMGPPLGCFPGMPEMPAVEVPPLEVPQAPELALPEFQAPEVTPPEGPELPAQPPESAGNCCVRTGKLLREKCGQATSCCTKEFEDTGTCEGAGGVWFFTEEGCLGAC
jgi:hypothetical protein